MDKVIYIESDEEITSVISKIKKSRKNKIALVIPKGSIILGSIVNLKMLKKHEKNLGKEITVVTTDRTGRNIASQIGFQAVHSLDASIIDDNQNDVLSSIGNNDLKVEFNKDKKEPEVKEKDDGPQITFKNIDDNDIDKEQPGKEEQEASIKEKNDSLPNKKKKNKNMPVFIKRVFMGFGILSIIFLILSFFFVLPKATIYVSPQAEELKEEVDLKVLVNNENKEFSGILIEAEQELSKNFKTTGKKNIGEKANGTITVYNEWDSTDQPLVSGTRFVSGGKIFRTTAAIVVPGTKIQEGKIIAGTKPVSVEADQPEEIYNIGPSEFIIPGLPTEKQAKIYGKSNSNMSGGYTKEVNIVSKGDIEQAKIVLDQELGEKLKESLISKSKNKKILEAAFRDELLEETISANEGQEANEFTLKHRKKIWTIAFDENAAEKIMISKIQETIPENKELVGDKVENTDYKIVDVSKENGLVASVAVTVFMVEKLELSRAKYDLTGKNTEEVTQYFKDKKEVKDVKIELWPFWVKKVPLNRSRIEIKLNITN